MAAKIEFYMPHDVDPLSDGGERHWPNSIPHEDLSFMGRGSIPYEKLGPGWSTWKKDFPILWGAILNAAGVREGKLVGCRLDSLLVELSWLQSIVDKNLSLMDCIRALVKDDTTYVVFRVY